MSVIIATLVAVVLLGAFSWRHRTHYLSERPFEHDRRTYVGAGALAAALAEASALSASQGPAGWTWLADFALGPVLLLWGDLRLSRAEMQLARWTLAGTRPSGRDAAIRLDPDRVLLSVTAKAPTLHAVASESLERQETMRALHPVGGDAWRRASTKIEALFALGADEVLVRSGGVSAVVPREHVTCARVTEQLDAVEELARVLEGTSG